MRSALADEIIRHSGELFNKRVQLLSLWQEIAENFYPERADFTVNRTLGEDFASHLTSSYPVMVRRELGNTIAAMLRPRSVPWFSVSVADEDRISVEARRWLQWATGVQRRAMYDPDALFIRATSEGDQDYATFGQTVISREVDLSRNSLLYRCWHLRDVAWCESFRGDIDIIYRKWKPTARDVANYFGKDKVSEAVQKAAEKLDTNPVVCTHAIVPLDAYKTMGGEKPFKAPWVSVYVENETGHLLSEEASFDQVYTIPRWQTVSGSQYAYSPSTVAALPDARLLQSMTLTLLEAGEKAANPPLVAQDGVIRSDVSVYAGGITFVDKEYDEKLGEALRPIRLDTGGIPLGMEMQRATREALASAFYLNKISLPPMVGEVTTFEISQRVQEYVRQALPLFEPMEVEYNQSLCESTFNLLMRNGAFGPASTIPGELRGQSVEFRFESPLREASGKQKGQTFIQAKALLAESAAVDPGALAIIDVPKALRDALDGIGVPATWTRSQMEMDAVMAAQREQQAQAQQMAILKQGAQTAESAGRAAQAFNAAGVV